jgi:DNA polymerase III subunit epsilon
MRFSDWRSWLQPARRWDDVVIWALDLETTGLRPERDHIISIGMVPIRGGVIRYGERWHQLVRPTGVAAIPTEGIRAHHILPAELDEAPPIGDVLAQVEDRLREGALLVHYADLDLRFLRREFARHDRTWPRPVVIDTVDLLLRWHARQQQWTPHPPPPRTALGEARADFRLPEYPSHDALSDALATAELFLVLRERLGLATLRGIR